MNNKQAIYNLGKDKRQSKVGNGEILENFNIKNLPVYIQRNVYKYKDWLN